MYKMMAESKGLVTHGVSACQGCGLELIMRNVMEALGEDTVIVIPPDARPCSPAAVLKAA